MEITKLNNVSFGKLHKNNASIEVKPTNKHKNRSGLIILGLIASGAIASAVLIKKKKINLPDFTKKLSDLNNIQKQEKTVNEATNSIQKPVQIQSEKTIETIADNSSKLADETNEKAVDTLIEESTKLDDETNKKAIDTIVEDNAKLSEEVQEETSEIIEELPTDKTEQTSEILEELPEEKVEQNAEFSKEIVSNDEIESTTVENAIEKSEEIQPDNSKAQEEIAETLDEIKDDMQAEKIENTLIDDFEKPLETSNDEVAEVIRNNPKTQEMIIKQNKMTNHQYILDNISNHPKYFRDFGIDKNIVHEFKRLNPDLVKEINDSEFLSLLLAPSEKIGLSFNEKMYLPKPRGKFTKIMEKTLLKDTKKAKYNRSFERRHRLYTVVKDILPTGDRIRKLKTLEDTFTPEEINKIFNNSNYKTRNLFLNWLIEFHNEAQDNKVLNNIKDLIK